MITNPHLFPMSWHAEGQWQAWACSPRVRTWHQRHDAYLEVEVEHLGCVQTEDEDQYGSQTRAFNRKGGGGYTPRNQTCIEIKSHCRATQRSLKKRCELSRDDRC